VTDKEIDKELSKKYADCPSRKPRMTRKYKLKMRYGQTVNTLTREILKTQEKLDLLIELRLELTV
jgi:hypothetical protein